MQTVHIGAVIEGGRDVAVGPDQYGGQCLLVGGCGDDVDALTPAVGDPALRWAVDAAKQQPASVARQQVYELLTAAERLLAVTGVAIELCPNYDGGADSTSGQPR